MRLRNHRFARRGASMTEMAIVTLIFLALVIGLIDVGVGVFRYHLLSEVARHGARQVIVHGEYAPSDWKGGTWGPTEIDATASDTGIPIIDALQPRLVGCDLAKTTIKVTWLEGDTKVGQRVRVTVSAPYQPFTTLVVGRTIQLSASSTMLIAH